MMFATQRHQAKYHLLPGWVLSPSDHERHWINAETLVQLYRVDPRECYLMPGINAPCPELIPLRPRSDGHYFVPGLEFKSGVSYKSPVGEIRIH